MKRKGILALAVGLVVMLAIGVSSALAAKHYRTKIAFLGNKGASIQDVTLFGNLNSNPKCVGARKVGLFKQTSSDSYKLLDVDLSSFNGAWALRADLTGTPDLAIQVPRSKRNHGKVICKAATLRLTPTSVQYPRVR